MKPTFEAGRVTVTFDVYIRNNNAPFLSNIQILFRSNAADGIWLPLNQGHSELHIATHSASHLVQPQ